MVNQRKSRDFEHNRNVLSTDSRKFFALVMNTNEEKSFENKKYFSSIDFESHIIF